MKVEKKKKIFSSFLQASSQQNPDDKNFSYRNKKFSALIALQLLFLQDFSKMFS